MADIAIGDYVQQLEDMIDQGQFQAVIAHGRGILEHYPKHLDTYRVMGKALLEAGQDQYAEDMFKRVLSGDPEDYLTRVAMSILYDRHGNLENALWHMEIAFELAPDNEAIRGEMRRMYGRRDGVEPGRLDLTPGALARTYVRGGLYQRAVEELQKLVEADPRREDLKIALAEACWRDGQRALAEQVCVDILRELPNCLKANLILGEIYTMTGRGEARELLRRAAALDPSNSVATELLGEFSPLPESSVQVPFLEYRPTAERPEWMTTPVAVSSPDATSGTEGLSAGMESELGVPDWLQGTSSEDEDGDKEAGGELDWLDQGQPAAGEDTPEDGDDWSMEASGDGVEVPGWLQGDGNIFTDDIGASEGEAPDWMQGGGDLFAADAGESAAGQPETWGTEAAGTEAEVPDWLQGGGDLFDADTGSAPSEGEVPDWLQGGGDLFAADTGGPAAGELSDWGAAAAPMEEAEEAKVPDWLGEELTEAEPAATAGEEAPDWLQGGGDDVAADAGGAVPGEMPDWIAEMAPPGALDGAPPEPDLQFGEGLEAEIPDSQPVPEPEPADAGAPSWLEEDGLPNGEDALAFLESLTAGKEDELRAAAEAEAAVRVADITGRPAEPEVQPVSEPEPVEAGVPSWLEEDGLPDGADALAFLESLTVGKEDELQAAAEAEAAARVADITGRAREPEPQHVPEPEPEPTEPSTPDWLDADGLPDGEDALAFLESLTVGKEDELRAAAEVEAAARVADITGRPREPEPQQAPEPEPEPVEFGTPDWLEGEGLPNGEDALAFLESLTVGKEDELRAAAEAEAAARVADITGRPAEPVSGPESVAQFDDGALDFEMPDWLSEAPQAEPQFVADQAQDDQEVLEAAVDAFGWTSFGEDLPQPVVTEAAEPPVEEMMPVEASPADELEPEPEPEPQPAEVEMPAPEVSVEPGLEEVVPRPELPLTPDLAELQTFVKANPRDREARLALARGLWQTGRYADSLEAYSRAMRSSKLVEEVLSDMESNLAERPGDPQVMRVLGDVYLRIGKLAEALEIYRDALEDL